VKVGGVPLFSTWPKDAKPDAVLVLSGQTFGFLSPCGCSKPQMGGLERRANVVSWFKSRGWPVAGFDLGDSYPQKAAVADQGLLKYTTGLNALRDMGYVAVGVGRTEFNAGLLRVVAEYALQKERPPFTLAGNVAGLADGKAIPREQFFPPAPAARGRSSGWPRSPNSAGWRSASPGWSGRASPGRRRRATTSSTSSGTRTSCRRR
jgi:hypothetical protein